MKTATFTTLSGESIGMEKENIVAFRSEASSGTRIVLSPKGYAVGAGPDGERLIDGNVPDDEKDAYTEGTKGVDFVVVEGLLGAVMGAWDAPTIE